MSPRPSSPAQDERRKQSKADLGTDLKVWRMAHDHPSDPDLTHHLPRLFTDLVLILIERPAAVPKHALPAPEIALLPRACRWQSGEGVGRVWRRVGGECFEEERVGEGVEFRGIREEGGGGKMRGKTGVDEGDGLGWGVGGDQRG